MPTENSDEPAPFKVKWCFNLKMNTPVILFRSDRWLEDEMAAAARHFPVMRYRAQVPPGSLVVCRYSALPFFNELEQDLQLLGSRPVNSLRQHQYVANFEYYEDLRDVTFPSWERLSDVPTRLHDQPFVVKGKTNSRKFEWHQKMFAPNFLAASRIAAELAMDGLIGQQGVLIRQYVPLETFEMGVTGTPFTNEWRVFYYKGKRLAHGYYWGNIDDWTKVDSARAEFEAAGLALADEVGLRIASKVPFAVVDVARTEDGRWMVVELNDGCQSGLNGVIEPDALYRALHSALADDIT